MGAVLWCAVVAAAGRTTFDEVRLDDWDTAEMVAAGVEAGAEAEMGVRPAQLQWLDRRFTRERAAAGGGGPEAALAWPDTLYAAGDEPLYGQLVAAGGSAGSAGRKGKRSGKEVPQYDYEQLSAEYEAAARDSARNATTEAAVPEEGVVAAVGRIVDVSRPRNCSVEAGSNYGPRALLCLWQELRGARTSGQRLRLLRRLGRIVAFWLLVWVAIAVPFWCHKGWCCWCLHPCFAFCRPRTSLRKVRGYLARNPPGKLQTEDGRVIDYEPTIYEAELFRSMERQVRRVLQV